MKTLKLLSLLCVALLLLSIPGMGNASSANTTATITFRNGVLRLDAISMDFSFGTQMLPPYEITTYPSVNSPNSITVTDARATSDGWRVTASYTPLTADDATDINTTLYLYDGTCANNNVTIPQTITLSHNSTDETIAAATAEAGRGVFVLLWSSAEQIELHLDESLTLDVIGTTYTATFELTLVEGP